MMKSQSALELLKSVRKPNQAVRLIGVGVSRTRRTDPSVGIMGYRTREERKVQDVLDELQEKYGKDVIKRGNVS